jgi:hypothetical protein
MSGAQRVRDGFNAALPGRGGSDLAGRLCRACVDLLAVDGAALSVIHDESLRGSLGASSALSHELDELQFTFGEGPCLDAVRDKAPVLIGDLDKAQARWPAFTGAAMGRGVRAVFALPVSVSGLAVGALDLYRTGVGDLDAAEVTNSLIAAQFAALPVLDVMSGDLNAAVDDDGSAAWDALSSLSRTEVYQATGMLIAQLGVGPPEALARLRGYAFAHDMTASEVAWEIIGRRLCLDDDRNEGS